MPSPRICRGYQGTIQVLRQQRGGWGHKWQFLLIYSTIYADVGEWVGGPKKANSMLT